MHIHRIQLPREVIMGEGIIKFTGDIARRLNIRSVLVVTGEHTYGIAGESVISSLKESGVTNDYVMVGESTMEEVIRVQKKILEVEPDAVAGVGGGKIIDVAKLASARQGVHFISIPTSASHDGTTSPFASIKGQSRPYSIRAHAPLAVIADTGIIMRAPYRFTASGCGDIISKTTAVKDWLLAHRQLKEEYSEYAADLALMSAKLVMRHADAIKNDLEKSIRVIVKALISCGVAMYIAGSSRPCSGSEHLFSHALDLICPRPALHGEQCGIGTIMMASLHGLNWRRMRDKLRTIGAPTTAEEM
ncbi:MAG: NAD(P)-dependent glycerol-1-phosphate dehydrogenase, partial [Candidatus Bathyarchaeia archaeon]